MQSKLGGAGLLAITLFLSACGGGGGSSPPPYIPPQAKVGIYGDSIVAGMVGKKLVPPFDTAVIAGVSGETSPQIADRVVPIAQVIFLEGGSNDLHKFPSESITSAYTRMLNKLTGVQVRVIGILPVEPKSAPLNERQNAINAQLVTLCKAYANCVPAIEAMQMDMTGLTTDGTHLNQAGYTALTTILAKYVP